MADEKNVVKYEAKDGQEITLTFDNVRRYLVQGNKDAVTQQELMYFLGICKSRGLNPFAKDAYLIKYGQDPAAIVTSIDYFRARARAQPDCEGWACGVIVLKTDGTLRYSNGLVLDGEKIVGGWFEAQPKGWNQPFKLEVNLGGYIKKTKDGRITRFWQEENQPTMIAKVAEGQGLRRLWPNEFSKIYEESEVRIPDIELSRLDNGGYGVEPKDKGPHPNLAIWDEQVKASGIPAEKVDEYISWGINSGAIKQNKDAYKVMIIDAGKMADFLKACKAKVMPKADEPPAEEPPAEEPEEKCICEHCGFEAKSPRGLSKHITQQHDAKAIAEEVSKDIKAIAAEVDPAEEKTEAVEPEVVDDDKDREFFGRFERKMMEYQKSFQDKMGFDNGNKAYFAVFAKFDVKSMFDASDKRDKQLAIDINNAMADALAALPTKE